MVFVDNKYARWYFRIILRRKNSKSLLTETKEKHHIIPKCLGGSNESFNIVSLTPKEHFICHLLLTKMVNNKRKKRLLEWAFHKLSFSTYLKRVNSKQYQWVRMWWSSRLKENHHSNYLGLRYRKKLSNSLKAYWALDEKTVLDRKKAASKRMQLLQQRKKEDYSNFILEQKRRAQIGGESAKQKCALRIEYKGMVYLGWNELKKNTGISKALYKKYYLNGICPEFRIGKNGPIARKENQ